MAKTRPLIRLDRLIILGMFLLIAVAVVGFQMLRSEPVRVDLAGTTPAKPSKVGEFRGIALQLHNPSPDHPYEQYIGQIAETGANTICLVVTAYQENCSSTSLFIEGRKSPSKQRLLELIALCRKRSMRVVLMPIVLLENPREGEWRGKIEPGNWDNWWEDYTNYIIHYAQIAEQADVDVLIIGSELVSTESQTDRWRNLIRLVRGVYAGRLCYSANWDHYRVIQFWSDLDIIGMTSYYDLTDGERPTIERLLEKWKSIKKEILDWQSKINRLLLFTEVGWPNQVTCAQYPWDYYRAMDKPDPQAQAICFEAFFQTWINEKATTGFLVWEWRNHPGQKGGPADTSYIPCGKPAMGVIQKYFQAPSPRQTTRPAAK